MSLSLTHARTSAILVLSNGYCGEGGETHIGSRPQTARAALTRARSASTEREWCVAWAQVLAQVLA